MPEARNSGRVMIDQATSQIGNRPIRAQFSVPTPSPSSIASAIARTTGTMSRVARASVAIRMPPSSRIATRMLVRLFSRNRASTASSQVTAGYCNSGLEKLMARATWLDTDM